MFWLKIYGLTHVFAEDIWLRVYFGSEVMAQRMFWLKIYGSTHVSGQDLWLKRMFWHEIFG